MSLKVALDEGNRTRRQRPIQLRHRSSPQDLIGDGEMLRGAQRVERSRPATWAISLRIGWVSCPNFLPAVEQLERSANAEDRFDEVFIKEGL
jgi:hypothetical protein